MRSKTFLKISLNILKVRENKLFNPIRYILCYDIQNNKQ